MSTAEVIMAVNRLSAVGKSCIGASYSVSGLSFQGRVAEVGGPIQCGCALLASGFPQVLSCAAVEGGRVLLTVLFPPQYAHTKEPSESLRYCKSCKKFFCLVPLLFCSFCRR
jgi:hypothetical protein